MIKLIAGNLTYYFANRDDYLHAMTDPYSEEKTYMAEYIVDSKRDVFLKCRDFSLDMQDGRPASAIMNDMFDIDGSFSIPERPIQKSFHEIVFDWVAQAFKNIYLRVKGMIDKS